MKTSFWVRSVSSAPSVLSGMEAAAKQMFRQSRMISTSLLIDKLEDETIGTATSSATDLVASRFRLGNQQQQQQQQSERDSLSQQSASVHRRNGAGSLVARRRSLLFEKITEVGKLKEEEMEDNNTSKTARHAAKKAKGIFFG